MTVKSVDLNDFLRPDSVAVLVEVEAVKGSAPREVGAWMVVTRQAVLGTIGGGHLEMHAIARARDMLGAATVDVLRLPLGPEIGQCCGGLVTLRLAPLDGGRRKTLEKTLRGADAAQPVVHVFGAGHVGRALGACLSLLPLRCVLVDQRPEELALAPAGVETLLTMLPEAVVRQAPSRSAFVILTHDHGLDFLIAAEALSRKDAAYVGMIGSATKRAVFARWLDQSAATVGGRNLMRDLVLPIGSVKVRDKRPSVIAALTAAEIMTALAVETR
jgi:xanthine dehydrogenase accessory factor